MLTALFYIEAFVEKNIPNMTVSLKFKQVFYNGGKWLGVRAWESDESECSTHRSL